MRLLIAAVGRLKDAERDLYGRYATRLDQTGQRLALGPLALSEIGESKAPQAEKRRADEAAALLKSARGSDLIIALDGRGKSMTSEAFARYLAGKRDAGVQAAAFLIGGPDGHGEAVTQAAALTLSLGPMTLPHGLARIVLAEQLYRAATILAGHPYHRA